METRPANSGPSSTATSATESYASAVNRVRTRSAVSSGAATGTRDVT